ncbi:hypothetical protein IE00_18940 [Paracoccus sp. SM22M-07]|nr:hypothetical protein IE00_18940 [Paracoccus sp. SM22M-07]
MQNAILTFDGLLPLCGRAEASENYFEFRLNANLSCAQLNELHRATIVLDGRAEMVLVESTARFDSCPGQKGTVDRCMIILRRNFLSPPRMQKAQ